MLIGTPSYMAPEQVRGAPVDERADIFAIGVILDEMVSGTQPVRARRAPPRRSPPSCAIRRRRSDAGAAPRRRSSA